MDNKNKQNFSRQGNTKACQSTDTNRKSNTDIDSNKSWPRSSRRRESNNNLTTFKTDYQRSSKQLSAKFRTNVDKRPRPRGHSGGAYTFSYNATNSTPETAPDDSESFADTCTGLDSQTKKSSLGGAVSNDGVCAALDKNLHLDYELNSVYTPGSKKSNLNHLLNFHYASRDDDYSMGISVFGRNGGASKSGSRHRYGLTGGIVKKHKYNKEQFMQANFQFVIKSSAMPKFNNSPDTLIDWNLIEQINIQTTEEPQCPICLYPPIAAKLTRCGHAYCWPCILHYLALSDKTWRKCPICYEAIHIGDLKSTAIVQQQQIQVGNQITFHLMRRQKGSMFIEKYTSFAPTIERYPLCSSNDDAKLFSKFLIAKPSDILDIILREHRELTTGMEESCPEFIFIQQALDLLKERQSHLPEIIDMKEPEEVYKVTATPMNFEAVSRSEFKELDRNCTDIHEKGSVHDITASAYAVVEEHIDDTLSYVLPIPATKYYYFYQSVDGQNIYLHPLNVKMLQACYGTLDKAPLIIDARILQKEHHSMDEDHRRKFTCLGHLPLTCQFAVVEVDLQPPIITDNILKLFKDDILYRKKERQQREREERRREKKINEINDRQMGKLIASTVNLNLSSSYEFPTCGFEESLICSNMEELGSTSDAVSTPNRNASYSTVAMTTTSRKERSDRKSGNNLFDETPVDFALDANNMLVPIHTSLGDVLAEALFQKEQAAVVKTNLCEGTVSGNKKKNKKSKKMVPLFSTGMNFNGK